MFFIIFPLWCDYLVYHANFFKFVIMIYIFLGVYIFIPRSPYGRIVKHFFSQVKKPALTMMCRLIHGRNLECTQYIALTIFFNCLTWGIIGFSTIKLRNQLPVHLPYFWMLAIGHIQKKIQNLNLFILIAMHLCGCI